MSLSRMPHSPVSNEPVYLWNVANRYFRIIPQLSVLFPSSSDLFEMHCWHLMQNKQISKNVNDTDVVKEYKYFVFVPFSVEHTSKT